MPRSGRTLVPRAARTTHHASPMGPELSKYLNTDLVLHCPRDPAPLVDALIQRGMHKLVEPEQVDEHEWRVWLEVDGVTCFEHPEATLNGILTAVEALPEAERQLWNECSAREFN